MKKALIVTARHPTPGRAKTRLAGALSVDQAAALYQCFLKDSLEIARSLTGATRYVAFTPADERDYFSCIAPDFGLFSQTGDDLGERLDNSLSRCLSEGFGGAVIVGSDCPTLPATYISRAFDLLEEADAQEQAARDRCRAMAQLWFDGLSEAQKLTLVSLLVTREWDTFAALAAAAGDWRQHRAQHVILKRA